MSIPDPTDVTQGLVSLLSLTRRDKDEFEARSDPHPGGHVFGGQVLAQALVAMGETIPAGRRIHALYGNFVEAATADQPLRISVDSLRDGGSFSVRQARVHQGGRTVLEATGSFQEPQEGMIHQDTAPEAPDPESLPSTTDLLSPVDHPMAQYLAHSRPIDIRHVTAPLYYRADASRASEQMVWMRALTPVPQTGAETTHPHLHDAILTFASDYTPFEPMLRRQGLTWLSPGLRMATLNHSIWWHGDVDMNEWVLFVQRSPSASGGRGLTSGEVFRRDGTIVATVIQEGMFRGPKPSSERDAT